jgi:hypothetical protein
MRNTEAAISSPPPALRNPRVLYHLAESSSLVIKGPVTGRTYLFAGRSVGLTVDERDIPSLIATGRFAVAPPKG